MATHYLVLRGDSREQDGELFWFDVGQATANNGTEAIRSVAGQIGEGHYRAVPFRNITTARAEVEHNPVVRIHSVEESADPAPEPEPDGQLGGDAFGGVDPFDAAAQEDRAGAGDPSPF